MLLTHLCAFLNHGIPKAREQKACMAERFCNNHLNYSCETDLTLADVANLQTNLDKIFFHSCIVLSVLCISSLFLMSLVTGIATTF